MKTSFIIVLVLIVIACGLAQSQKRTDSPLPQVDDPIRALSAQYPAKTADLLLRRMQAELPKGWRASYDKEHSLLRISRDEAIVARRTIINGPSARGKPEQTEFAFLFRVIPLVSPEQYRRLNKENAQTGEKLSALYKELVKKRISHKFDSFSGVTDEDKVAVARYDALKASLHCLPAFYFEEISVEWIYGSMDDSFLGPSIDIEDERIREECMQIQKKILSLLSKYENA